MVLAYHYLFEFHFKERIDFFFQFLTLKTQFCNDQLFTYASHICVLIGLGDIR